MASRKIHDRDPSNSEMYDLIPREEPDSIEIYDRNCVLILDQDKRQIEYLQNCFSQQNFKVIGHTSGELGFRAAKKSQPDCIIVNTELIDMDGIDLCQSLVDDSTTCGIPVICIGAADSHLVVQHAKAAGCQFFLSKPVDPRSVIFLVNEAIADARSWIFE